MSILGYDNLFTALNLGIGSAISVLILICVAIIAFVFIKGFGAAAPGARGEADGCHHQQKVGWVTANTVTVMLVLIPVLWIFSLSFKNPATIAATARRSGRDWTW